MDKTIDKISSYEIFNVFFPGALLCGYCICLFGREWPTGNIMQGVWIFCIVYLCGIVLSRIGGLVVQPLARKTGLIEWSDGYYQAERKDPKLAILLKDFNMYGSLIAATIVAIVIMIWASISGHQIVLPGALVMWSELLLLLILILAYRKQSKYISKRINNIKEN